MAGESVMINGTWVAIAELDRPLLASVAEHAVKLLRMSAVEPGHYSSTIPPAADVERYIARLPASPPRSVPGVALDLDAQLALAESFAGYGGDYDAMLAPETPRRFRSPNDYFGDADAFFMYAMLRRLQPKRVIEVGTGYSSAFMLDVRERFCTTPFDATFIDINPANLRALVPVDEPLMRLLEQPVETCDVDLFRSLESGDVLSIDSSHVFRAGGDLMFLMWEVLPALASGCIVHFHDIYYPFEYPVEMLRRGVFYNEAYVLRAFLTDNAAWNVDLFASYLNAFAPERMQRIHPTCTGGSSLWLRKR
jgi:hypothetical protein